MTCSLSHIAVLVNSFLSPVTQLRQFLFVMKQPTLQEDFRIEIETQEFVEK